MKITQNWLRTLGIFGAVGGFVLFAGDMFFYYDGKSTDFILNMAYSSNTRIIASTITALVGAWLYLLGLGQVYYAFKPASNVVRNIMAVSFGAILISYGVIHGAYVAIATSAKLAFENNLDITKSIMLATESNNALRLIIYPIFALLSTVFIYQVWKKNTLYPRWIIVFFPLLPFLLKAPIERLLSGRAFVIIIGGYLNLILVVFFVASTIALWQRKEN